jgi:hypothetical protein
MIRTKQRGIPKNVIHLITEYGIPVKRKGNALEYSIRKKQIFELIERHRSAIDALQKADSKAVLVSEDTGEIITVYHKTSLQGRR